MGKKVHLYPDEFRLMSFEQRKEHKEKLLRKQIAYVYKNSPEYYRVCFKECGAEPGDIRTIEDLRKLPIFMDKDRERESMQRSIDKYGHPFGLHVCCGLDEIISTGGTAGTTGHSTYPYTLTRDDLGIISDLFSKVFTEVCGLGPGDRGLFTYPLGVYATTLLLSGMRQAGILPIDIDIRLGTKPIIELARLMKPNCWWTGPTIALYYIDRFANDLKIDAQKLGLKCILVTGEILLPEVKRRIEQAYGCLCYDYWGPSATSPSISCGSAEYYGLHKFAEEWDISYEDLCDPITKRPLEIKEGVVGEIVATHLYKKASPYVRYATGDVVQLYTSECPACGFNGYRVKVIGRSDDMITVKGVNVFGRVIREALQQFVPRVTGRMRIIKDSPSPQMVTLKLRVEYAHGMEDRLEDLSREIRQVMKTDLRVTPEIEWAKPETLKVDYHKEPLFEKRYI